MNEKIQYRTRPPSAALKISSSLLVNDLFFYLNINVKENAFFKVGTEKGIARRIDASSVVWTLRQWQISQSDCEISGNCGTFTSVCTLASQSVQKLSANILRMVPTKLGYEGSDISDCFILVNGPLN